MDWLDSMSSRSEDLTPRTEDLLNQPAKEINNLMKNNENKNIEDLLK